MLSFHFSLHSHFYPDHDDTMACTVSFTTEKHYELPRRLEYINGIVTHPSLGKLAIATVKCLKITGRMWFKTNRDFLEIMDEESHELNEFSVALFDEGSNLRTFIIDGGPRSGSGCWGMELGVGDMLYVDDLEVKEEFRHQGVGSLILRKLLTDERIGYRGHAYVWPTPNSSVDSEAAWLARRDTIIAFYRKNGFRRIGFTSFFAYSPDPSHPSRQLTASAEPDPPSKAFETTTTGPALTQDEDRAEYPLHFAIAADKTPLVVQTLRTAYEADHASIRQRHPRTGLLPIHVAAASENVLAIQALLALYAPEPDVDRAALQGDLKDRNNKNGLTPLEILDATMTSRREIMETLVGRWDGYEEAGVRCEYALKRALGERLFSFALGDANMVTEDEYVEKRKWGCTCGMCTDGWLSPRMRLRLSAQAGIQYDMLKTDMDAFTSPHRPVSYLEIIHSTFDYIPPAIRKEIYESFYVGVYTIFYAICQVLETPSTTLSTSTSASPSTSDSVQGPPSSTAPMSMPTPNANATLPTPQTILSKALELDAGAVSFYLSKGGKVEFTLDAVLDMAREQSVLGDGTFEETFDVEEGGGGDILRDDGYTHLPKCANDLRFGGVRQHVGVAGGRDEMEDEDEDEEDEEDEEEDGEDEDEHDF
ncbi:hypothetical protein CPB84DRAFT_1793501 [Gymnopilus junonius]|uniref:N-acetyltransferase domain-containing protein n=1 Tax=Gymnopilus junonius TaxID=109634 RepID=A0A9P5NBQ3_GYMJU|nr:hypothetical protein CPB84DRAFT_1793501 [Gymnopilus junonius]